MQDSDHFLKAAFQLGPWRVTRRVLLFITVFCAVIIIFGAIVLKTHMFDEDENFDWDDDDDDDDWEALDELSGGDAVMLVIIGLAGVTALVACGGCFMATSNSPQQLNSHSGSIFTLSGTVPPPASAGATLPRAAPPPSRHPRSARRSTRDEGKLASGHSLGPSYPHNPDFPQSGGPPQQHRHHQNYPENPSFLPPGYPPHPPPSYSAPSYPPSGHGHGVPSHAPATLADLPPPYTPGHMGQQRR